MKIQTNPGAPVAVARRISYETTKLHEELGGGIEVKQPDPVLILEFRNGKKREYRGDELDRGLELARQCPAFR